jgi:cbb3-type cytochrome oxidase subunit 3
MLASTFVADLSYRQWSVMVLMLALLLVLLMLFRRVEREHTERE